MEEVGIGKVYVFWNYMVWVPTPPIVGDPPRKVGGGRKAKERSAGRLAGLLPSAFSAVPAGAAAGSF